MERKIDLESVLSEIGYIGRTQSFYFALLCFIAFFTGCFTMMNAFTAGDLNYRCFINQCDKNGIVSADYIPEWLKYAVPFDEDSELPEKCFVYKFASDPNQPRDSCDANDFNNKTTIKCNEFVYETDEKTILTEFGLPCTENKWKLTLPGTISSMGKFFNMLMVGYFSDRYGRKTVFIASAVIASTMAMGQMLSFNYWMFLVFTFLETWLGGSTYTICIILSLELVSPAYRTVVGAAIFALAAGGTMYLGLIAMLVLHWQLLILICYIPNFIIITYIWLLPESITWLQVKGRYRDIANILLRIIKWNKIKMSDEVHDILVNSPEKMFENKLTSDEESKTEKIFPLCDVFRSRPMTVRILCLAYCWFTNLFIFYGLSRISVTIGGNKFTDFIIASAMEIPACALVTLVSKRIGRNTILRTAFLVSGFTLLIYTFVSHIYWVKMILFMIGKFAITMSFCIIMIYTSELVPTNLRHTLIGLCAGFGRIGSLIAPQAPLIDVVMKNLSIYVFAGFAIVGGLITFLLPETLNCKLPDTIEEALQIGKRNENKSVES